MTGARRRWAPVISRIYHIPPWEIGRLTLREWSDIHEDLAAMNRDS